MMTRPLIVALLGSLVANVPAAHADRRTKRDADESTEEEQRPAKKSAGRAKAKVTQEDDEDEAPATAKKKLSGTTTTTKAPAPTKAAARRAAEADDDDSDGPEAKAAVSIDLDDLIDSAIRQAPELAKAKTAKDEAKGNKDANRHGWQFTVQGQYKQNGIGGDVQVAPLTEVESQEFGGSIGFGRQLNNGANVTFETGYKSHYSEYAISADLLNIIKNRPLDTQLSQDEIDRQTKEEDVSNQAYAQVTFTQPVLRGFGVAGMGPKKGSLQHALATVNTQMAAEKMLKEIVIAYWELAYQAYDVDTRAEALASAQKQDQITRDEIRAGTKSLNNLNAVTYQIMQRSEQLLASRNEYERRSLELRNKVGLGLQHRDVVLRPSVAFEIGKEEWDINDTIERAHHLNRGLAANALQRRIDDIDVKIAENNKLPALDFTAQGGIVGSGKTSGEAFNNAAGADGYQVMLSAKLQFETGPAAKGQYDAARARRNKTDIEQMELNRKIDSDVARAVKAVTAARARVGFADKAISVAEDNLRAARASFQANVPGVDNFQIMQRQQEIIDAKLNRGKAIMDYHVAVAELQALSGQLLEQYGVSVRGKVGQ